MNSGTTAPAPLDPRIRSGANWFYWIAALSLLNSIMFLTGKGWGFIVGPGVTQVIDAVALSFEAPGAKLIVFIFDLAVAGLVVLLGYLARRSRALYVTGMVLYALDGLIFLFVQDWIALGFHAFVLFTMRPGLAAFSETAPTEQVVELTATPAPEPLGDGESS